MKRGIILTPNSTFGEYSISGDGISNSSILRGIIYFDKLALPSGAFKYTIEGEDYLKEKGILETPYMRTSNGMVIPSQQYLDCFDQKQNDRNTRWALNTSSDGMSFDETMSIFDGPKRETLALEIPDLPIPTHSSQNLGDYPFEDLLEFRYKTRDEFERLSIALEDYYLDWVEYENQVDRQNQITKKLKNKIDDVTSVTNESKLSFGVGSLKIAYSADAVKVNLVKGLFGLTAAHAAAHAAGPVIGFIAGSFIASVIVTTKRLNNSTDDLRPFEYINLVKKNL